MHSYHSQKLAECFEGINCGRLRKIRRRTLARQLSLYEMLSDYESLTESQQIQNMHWKKYRINGQTPLYLKNHI